MVELEGSAEKIKNSVVGLENILNGQKERAAMPLSVIQGDLTKMPVDAVVNAANSGLQWGGGVCGAIFAAADGRQLQRKCNQIGHCPVGEAVITDSCGLPAPYVIHAVGPVWQGGGYGEQALLAACYRNALTLAQQYGCESVAFPLISAGIYGYPKEEAFLTAVNAIQEFLRTAGERSVYLVLLDQALYRRLSQLEG